MNMKKPAQRPLVSLLFLICFFMSRLPVWAGLGDTTVVQTLRFDSTLRAGVFLFPDDSSKTYQKIVMLYSMRCKNGLISTGSNTNLGCGEWDYNCYTYVVDSAQTDSLRTITGSYKISNFNDSVFSYTNNPVYSYTLYTQQQVSYTSTISEVTGSIGSGNTPLNEPFDAAQPAGRSQYLFTANELTLAGLPAGDITGLRLDISAPGSTLDNLRIRLKATQVIALNPALPETEGFTEVYFLNTSLAATGLQSFNFYTPFNWDGISNVIADISYTNASAGVATTVNGHDAGFTAALHTSGYDAFLQTNGSLSCMKINPGFFPAISDQVTVAFWLFGDSLQLPANTSIIEGVDANNNRQVNIHMPWSNSDVYWDCGNDGSGYDRISKTATAQEIAGRWNFWAFTKNAVTGVMNIYLNGALWHTGTGMNKLIDIHEMVAGMNINAAYVYRGSYDEFSFWNKELSQASIGEIMYRDITPAHPDYSSLMAYYRLNEGSGNLAADDSPGNYDAELVNPCWRSHRGHTRFRNFWQDTFRPNAVFVQGVYTSSVITSQVTDSMPEPATSVISYQVVANDLEVIDTVYVWQSGYAYIYNPQGMVVDSVLVPSQNTITVTPLTYYQKRPMRLELINFITPYGINLNLDGLTGKTWEFDVTDFAPVLKGARFLAMEDGKYQEDNDIKFVFYEGVPPRDVKFISQVWPSGSWVSPSYNDIVANRYFEPRDLTLPANASGFKIRSAISGHGQEGEFIARNHTITLNGFTNYTRSVWKTCAMNPVYPQGGTWIYDRAGWCPGAAVDMKEYELTPNVTPGAQINLDYSLPPLGNPGSSNYRVNNQLVGYGAPNFTVDAAVDFIKSPSRRIEFLRRNPICNAPVLTIRNTGSTVLTSVNIHYGRVGATLSTYAWTGSLNFLETAEVTLPAPDWSGSNTNEFMAYVTDPNGGADLYAGNDTLYSPFDVPVVYPSGLIFELKTNNYGSQTNYSLRDAQGNFIISRSGLGNNIIYRDTVNLGLDCFTVNLNDLGHDGLSWWANTGQGTGYFRIRSLSNGAIIKTFNPDFGDNIYQQFTVTYALPVEEPLVEEPGDFAVFPNPASEAFRAVFSLPLHAHAIIRLLNVLGQELQTEQVEVSQPVERLDMDVSAVENGIYYVMLESGPYRVIRKLVVER